MPRILVRAMRMMRKSSSAMTTMADTIPYDLAICQDGRTGVRRPLKSGRR